jgi:hypothetical protein
MFRKYLNRTHLIIISLWNFCLSSNVHVDFVAYSVNDKGDEKSLPEPLAGYFISVRRGGFQWE